MNVDREKLCRRWVHAHEEDSDRAMVFRPAGTELPPSRGRTSLDLRDDGSLVEGLPGPVDRPQAETGAWTLDQDQLVLKGREKRLHRILEATPDRLVLEKP